MNYQPENLQRWKLPDSYFGAEWHDYYSSGCGQSRDSDALERSNFICMLRELGDESDTVTVVRESHWAVGWVEWIAIHQSDGKALQCADEISAALSDYPVIDESHWSEIEQEEADETWRNCYSPQDRIDYIRKFRSQFEFHDYADLIGCVRGKYFAGYASELLA
jgi:hypothetical protein